MMKAPIGAPEEGKYEVKEKGDDYLIIKIDAKSAPSSEMKCTFDGDDKMTLEPVDKSEIKPGQPGELVLKRSET